MTFKEQLADDLSVWLNVDEFAEEIDYVDAVGLVTKVVVQFFDDESDLGDSMFRKLIARKTDLPTMSKNGYFLINGDKYGIVDFNPDEQDLLWNVLTQKGML
jgi:hypothetical protein